MKRFITSLGLIPVLFIFLYSQTQVIPSGSGGGGSFTVASQAETWAGTNNTNGITPLRLNEEIDLRCGASVSTSTMTLFPGASPSRPCTFGFNNTVYSFTAPKSIVITAGAGSDTAYIQVLTSGGVNVLSDSVTFDNNGYTSGVGTDWTDNSIHLFTWTITDDEWDANGKTEQRAMYTRDPVTGTGGISCVDASNVTTCSLDEPANDFMNMSYWRFHVLPWALATTATFAPMQMYCEANDGNSATETLVANEPRGYAFGTGSSTPTSGDYITCAVGGDAAAPSSRPRFNDFVGSFKAFEIGAALRVAANTSIRARFGVFGTDVDATPADFVGIVLDTGTDSNWRCQICTTADGCSSSATTVASSTNAFTAKIEATATGTVSCTINSTTMTHTDTFPSFASGTNVSVQAVTLTTAERSISAFEIKGRVAR